MNPTTIDLADQPDAVAEVASKAKATNVLNPNRIFIVEGERSWSPMVLAAKKIVFKADSKLIFDNTNSNAAGHFHIVADEIEQEDPARPGIITWYTEVPVAPADRGQAPAGANGAGTGAPGGNGAPGAPGATGLLGASAPDLTLYVRTLGGGGPIIKFSGGKGGPGGLGQQGGNGGGGTQGESARQARANGPFGTVIWLPSCESGPGRGGDGGAGGPGGQGGTGGQGGNGGNVTLISLQENIPVLFQAVRVDLGGGEGGDAGAGNRGGDGGLGGPEGPLASFCNSAGRNGAPGPQGTSGPAGNKGEAGRSGQPFVGQLTNQQFSSLFGFE